MHYLTSFRLSKNTQGIGSRSDSADRFGTIDRISALGSNQRTQSTDRIGFDMPISGFRGFSREHERQTEINRYVVPANCKE